MARRSLGTAVATAVLFASVVTSTESWGAPDAKLSDAKLPRPTLIVVAGAPGDDEYAKIFQEELDLWAKTASASDVRFERIGAAPDNPTKSDAGGPTDKQRLQTLLKQETTAPNEAAPLWLVLIGHGTFDGRIAAFNLRGPDLTSTELADWLKDARRPLAVIDTTAASAPFLTALSAPGRVVISATKSGQQRNYARFGRFFARRVSDRDADLDKDEQTSLFEAFLAAARDTADFYKREGRIASEHPLLDDNGDGRGVRTELFVRDRLAKPLPAGQSADGDLARRFVLQPSDTERGLTAAQIARRDSLEKSLVELRARKAELAEDEYFERLEKLLVELARIRP